MRIGSGEGFTHKELHSLYQLPNIRVIKSRRLRWIGHVVRMEEGKISFKILQLKIRKETPRKA
jgi:hypothetical protein